MASRSQLGVIILAKQFGFDVEGTSKEDQETTLGGKVNYTDPMGWNISVEAGHTVFEKDKESFRYSNETELALIRNRMTEILSSAGKKYESKF